MTVSEKCAGFNLIHLLPVLIQVCGRFMPLLASKPLKRRLIGSSRDVIVVVDCLCKISISDQGRARTGLGLSRVGARQSRSQGFRLMNNGGRTQRSYKVCQKEEGGVGRRELMALLCDDECRQPRQVYCLTKMGKP